MANNVDAFTGALHGGRAHQRIKQQNRFEYRVACSILRAFEPNPGDAKALIHKLETVTVFDIKNMGFPLHLVTVKLRRTVSVPDILKFLMRTPLKAHIEEAFDTFQTEPFALIFASDGDEMQDLILHNEINIDQYMQDWFATLPKHELRLSTLKGFLVAARQLYDTWYIEDV